MLSAPLRVGGRIVGDPDAPDLVNIPIASLISAVRLGADLAPLVQPEMPVLKGV
jgi:hypothetical protein